MKAYILPILAGAAAGILSGFGVGGGSLLLIYLTAFAGVGQAQAQGINLLYFLPTAGMSLFAHRKNGYLDTAALRAAIPTGVLCALLAALAATTLDTAVLRRPFGLFLLYAGVSILFEKPPTGSKKSP